jgi:hypothetical protein
MFWMVAALVLVMIAFINVVISSSPDDQKELGTLGRVFINLIVIFPVIIVYLMSYGRLPSYLIYEEDDGEEQKGK